MEINKVRKAFEYFNHLNIIIIGDVMIDSYFWGKVDRISPEAPVPIITGLRKEHRPGGASNVALNIKALGAHPILCSVIGDDDAGVELVNILKKENISSDGIVKVKNRPTTIKTRVISQGQHLLRIDEETTKPIDDITEELFVDKIEALINSKPIDAIIFEDYDKGVITENLISQITTLANQKKIPTLVDPKKRNYHAYKNVTFFKPNFKEFIEGIKVDIPKGDFEQLYQHAIMFKNSMNIQNIFITLAELGVFVCNDHGYKNVPTQEKIEIADVSGAGDTVISVCAVLLASGLSIDDVAIIANFAGGQVCEKTGVVPVNKEELLKKLEEKFI